MTPNVSRLRGTESRRTSDPCLLLHLWPMSKRAAPVDEEAWLEARKKLLKAEKEFTKKLYPPWEFFVTFCSYTTGEEIDKPYFY